jgi:hypothetical protein
MAEPGRPQMAILYGACALHAGIHKPIDTRWKQLWFVAFLLQQRLRERYSVLVYKYSACLVLMLVSLRTIHTRAALNASF